MALENPRYEDSPALFITGVHQTYPHGTLDRSIEQLSALPTFLPLMLGRIGANTYGLWYDLFKTDKLTQLVTGARIGQFSPINTQLSLFELPAQRYAVFTHRGHISEMSKTRAEVFERWLPRSGKKHYQPPQGFLDCMEVYPEGFVAETGLGPIELWVPIQ